MPNSHPLVPFCILFSKLWGLCRKLRHPLRATACLDSFRSDSLWRTKSRVRLRERVRGYGGRVEDVREHVTRGPQLRVRSNRQRTMIGTAHLASATQIAECPYHLGPDLGYNLGGFCRHFS